MQDHLLSTDIWDMLQNPILNIKGIKAGVQPQTYIKAS